MEQHRTGGRTGRSDSPLARYGFNTMIAAYSLMNILWLGVLQQLNRRIIGLRLSHFLKDTLPFLLAALLSAGVAYWAGELAENMIVSIAVKIVVAATLYYIIMWWAGAEILKECVNYAKRKAPTVLQGGNSLISLIGLIDLNRLTGLIPQKTLISLACD